MRIFYPLSFAMLQPNHSIICNWAKAVDAINDMQCLPNSANKAVEQLNRSLPRPTTLIDELLC